MHERALDEWWHTLSARRKAQIHGWLSKDDGQAEIPGQMVIFTQGQEQEGEEH